MKIVSVQKMCEIIHFQGYFTTRWF